MARRQPRAKGTPPADIPHMLPPTPGFYRAVLTITSSGVTSKAIAGITPVIPGGPPASQHSHHGQQAAGEHERAGSPSLHLLVPVRAHDRLHPAHTVPDANPIATLSNVKPTRPPKTLPPATEMHYRIVAQNTAGITYGPDQTFLTG